MVTGGIDRTLMDANIVSVWERIANVVTGGGERGARTGCASRTAAIGAAGGLIFTSRHATAADTTGIAGAVLAAIGKIFPGGANSIRANGAIGTIKKGFGTARERELSSVTAI